MVQMVSSTAPNPRIVRRVIFETLRNYADWADLSPKTPLVGLVLLLILSSGE